MSRTLLMESLLGETRLAVIEDGQLCELYVERPGADDAVGDIYLGRVENVVRGMNAAFVDIGREKNGFLSANDIRITDRGLASQLDAMRIEKLAHPGETLLVQVTKAQSGQKGHRLSCHITLPGRLLVLLTDVRYTGVSRKIADRAERDRLYDIARGLMRDTGMGVILRTASEGASEDELRAEWDELCAQWRALQTRAAHTSAPRQLYSNASLLEKCARDMLDDTVDAVWADGKPLYDALAARAGEKTERVRLHDSPTPLFDLYRVDAQLDKALRKYVWLRSGGSLVIEETEAMTVVDVNTGKYLGSRDLEDTLFKLNCEAAEELVRQLRLRDIGGIVVVDFIDMREKANNDALLEHLKALTKTDRNRLSVVGMTGLGLVELTRKKERRPLSRQLLHTCSSCGGDGMTPSHETAARRIAHELWRRRRGGMDGPLLVSACPEVVGWLRTLGKTDQSPVYCRADRDMKSGEYDIAPADEARLPEGAKPLK